MCEIYSGKGYGPALGSYKPSSFIRDEGFLKQLGHYSYRKRKSVPFFAIFKSEKLRVPFFKSFTIDNSARQVVGIIILMSFPSCLQRIKTAGSSLKTQPPLSRNSSMFRLQFCSHHADPRSVNNIRNMYLICEIVTLCFPEKPAILIRWY